MKRAHRSLAAAWALGLILAAASTSRADNLFVIDAGHGGHDLGAVVKGLCEKDVTLAIARKVKDRLAKIGASVRLTRDSDVFLPLDERVGDGERGTIFVSLHTNDVSSKRREGITVYAFGKDRHHIRKIHRKHAVPPLAPPPDEERRESATLADMLVHSLRAQGYRVDDPARAGFYVLKNPEAASVLVELGYLSNPKEAARLRDPAYQDKLAQALAVSLESYAMLHPAGSKTGSRLEARLPAAAPAGGSK